MQAYMSFKLLVKCVKLQTFRGHVVHPWPVVYCKNPIVAYRNMAIYKRTVSRCCRPKYPNDRCFTGFREKEIPQ